ncbi:MAG: deoxyribose-phosphate aldolase [Acidobacteriota bacterium]
MEKELAGYIDHTMLKAEACEKEIHKLCREALQYGFAAVCINPCWVSAAARLLSKSSVCVCTVVGFPLGASTSDVKVFETRRAVFDGAQEIDMVINVGALKGGEDDYVREDIKGVVRASHDNGAICKVILETALLSDEEKVKACTLAKEVGADFVKTSTGFGPGGATAEDVALMARVVGPGVGVKAAGGIRDLTTTRSMLDAGATRIGASAGVRIVSGEVPSPRASS